MKKFLIVAAVALIIIMTGIVVIAQQIPWQTLPQEQTRLSFSW